MDVVKRVYKEKLAKNPNYKFKQALTDAKPLYKKLPSDGSSPKGKSRKNKGSRKRRTRRRH